MNKPLVLLAKWGARPSGYIIFPCAVRTWLKCRRFPELTFFDPGNQLQQSGLAAPWPLAPIAALNLNNIDIERLTNRRSIHTKLGELSVALNNLVCCFCMFGARLLFLGLWINHLKTRFEYSWPQLPIFYPLTPSLSSPLSFSNKARSPRAVQLLHRILPIQTLGKILTEFYGYLMGLRFHKRREWDGWKWGASYSFSPPFLQSSDKRGILNPFWNAPVKHKQIFP